MFKVDCSILKMVAPYHNTEDSNLRNSHSYVNENNTPEPADETLPS